MELLTEKGFKLSTIMKTVGLFTFTPGGSNPGLRPDSNPYLQVKEKLEGKKGKFFIPGDHQVFAQHKASLERLLQVGNIKFLDEKSQEQKDLINEQLAFELTYLGYKDELPLFELGWTDYIYGLNAGGEVRRLDKYQYLGIMQLKEFESNALLLDQIMVSEPRHLAQFLLRDLHNLDSYDAKLFYTNYHHAFLESSEHLNNKLYNSLSRGEDVFKDVPIDFDLSRIDLSRVFDITESHLSAENISTILLTKIKQWNLADPLPSFKAYSRLLTLVDFSPVGSFINSIDGLVDEALYLPSGIPKLEKMLKDYREALTRGGVVSQFEELIPAILAKNHVKVSLLKMEIKEPFPPSLSEEDEYSVRVLSRLVKIQSPEELLQISEEAMRNGRFLAI
jgi:hypothetical protein